MSFYMILNEYHPTILKIFQKRENLIPHFQLGSSHFELFHALDDYCTYHVRCGDFKITIKFTVSMRMIRLSVISALM